jgi:hypothetical protein
MSYKKELSKCCANCGVEWLPDLSNKAVKRALCKECKLEYDREYRDKNPIKRRLNNRLEKKGPYKMANRTKFWQSLSRQLKGMKKREEWVAFIQNRMDEILNDKVLMDYINDTDVLNKYDTEQ